MIALQGALQCGAVGAFSQTFGHADKEFKRDGNYSSEVLPIPLYKTLGLGELRTIARS
jgi:hypothetical protein